MILNDITRNWVGAYIKRPSAAIIIETNGDDNTGSEIAAYIHKNLKSTNKQPLIVENYEKNKSIGIDDIRSIQSTLFLKANKSEGISRMMVIDRAERLTVEAQNALLKLIEELPRSTVICLSVRSSSTLLDTIRSRCFIIPVLPISMEQAMNWAQQNEHDEAKAKRAFSISEGNYTLYKELLADDNHALFYEIKNAKDFFASTVFRRQKMLEISVDKQNDTELFLKSLMLSAKAAMRSAPSIKAKNRWKSIIEELLITQSMLDANVSTKLALLRLSTRV